MNRRKTLVTIMAISLILGSYQSFAQTAEDLISKGIQLEEVKGELEKAIEVYQTIVTRFSDNRPIAAKALYHIGLCYEKLGIKEAQKVYQRLIEEYPGQKREVAMAKERLTVLTKALEIIPHKPTFRKIRNPTKLTWLGRAQLSPDGKKLAFGSEGNIWVVPVSGKVSPDITGEPVKLPGTEGAWGTGLSWSADGKWIAYNRSKDNMADDICIIPSSGGKVKSIPVSKNRTGWGAFSHHLSLSPDGKILAFNSKEIEKSSKSQENRIYTIPVDGGDVKCLTGAMTWQASFSPDGKMIAYVKVDAPKEGKHQSDVWVISAAGGTPVKISNLPGLARGPVWSPDGKMIAFVHFTAGIFIGKEICIVPVSETGKPEAAPTKIDLPLVTFNFPAGWTSDNKIGLLLRSPEHRAIYIVPASGGKATQVTPAGLPIDPRWSPDGKRIYFRWGPGGIASVPSEGGEVSKGPLRADSKFLELTPGGGNAVSPDGEKIVFSGAKAIFEGEKISYEVNIYTIPIEGGEPIQLTTSSGVDRYPCWSPDGKSVAFIHTYEEGKGISISNIYTIPAEGGEAIQVTSESDKVYMYGSYIDWSPDGKLIAYFSSDKTINVIPAEGGEPKVVVKVEDAGHHSDLTWSRDGKKIAYVSKGSIWVVSSDGEHPVEVRTGLDAEALKVAWSPDGKKIAFTATKGGEVELWMMENFLPLVKGKK